MKLKFETHEECRSRLQWMIGQEKFLMGYDHLQLHLDYSDSDYYADIEAGFLAAKGVERG